MLLSSYKDGIIQVLFKAVHFKGIIGGHGRRQSSLWDKVAIDCSPGSLCHSWNLAT